MGMLYRTYLDGKVVYACKYCSTHLAKEEDCLSRGFQGKFGTAYLFDGVCNVCTGKLEERDMRTGLYLVRDICCIKCDANVGWTYIKAHKDSERYKEGKFILEINGVSQIE